MLAMANMGSGWHAGAASKPRPYTTDRALRASTTPPSSQTALPATASMGLGGAHGLKP